MQLLILLCITGAWASARLDPLVDSKKGLIRGLQATDGDYSMFLGIPYALVNYTNPFGPSLPYPVFEETFEAYDDNAICLQTAQITNEITGSLDCLHLNIYVPNSASKTNKLPVLLWIHGGSFQYGNAGRYQYGPKFLVQKDVIFVTVNYRVGIYGFMCLDTPEVPGNQGLKDQVVALQWIQENIESFGGDATKVTIFGSSAGGVSVDYHILSNEKLFDKAITQSGTTLRTRAIMKPDNNVPIKIAAKLGFNTDDVTKAVKFLIATEPKLVVATAFELSITCIPCLEKDFEGDNKFITDYPINTPIPTGKDIPVLIGHNSQEQLSTYGNKSPNDYNEGIFNKLIEQAFINIDKELETLVKRFYIGDEAVSAKVKSALTDFDSDFTLNHPIHRSLSKFLHNNNEVFFYVFSYSGGRNYGKWRHNVTEDGASHSDEKGYLFDMSMMTDTPTAQDQLVIDRMTTMWTNFVKYGDPTPETTDLLPVKWTPLTKNIRHYIEINSDVAMKRNPFNKRMAFWDLFYKKNEKLLIGYNGQ